MERRLAAIFFADLVGYSRRMQQEEPGNSARAFSNRRAEAPLKVCGTLSVYIDVIEEPEEG